MNLLDNPDPFAEALNHWLSKTNLPTNLSSAQIRQQLSAELRRQSRFSAHTLDTYYLDEISSAVESVLNPKTEQREDRVTESNPQGKVTTGLNPAAARVQLRQALVAIGYQPEEGQEGMIKDLSSEARLNLVIKTNVQLAQGAGQFVQGNLNPDVVEAFPAWELVRYEDRMIPRGEKRGPKDSIVPDPGNDWPSRFRAACEDAGDDDALDVLDKTGRMIALKSSGVWQSLGDGAGDYEDTLGNPYPPFAFNSGMWTDEVSRAECIAVGLIDDGDKVKPSMFDLASLFNLKEAA